LFIRILRLKIIFQLKEIYNFMKSPIIYKQIPTQYAFYVSEDGSVKVTIVTKLNDMKFSNEKEARDYIKKLKEVL